MFDMSQMQNLVWQMFSKQTEQFPPELKQTLKSLTLQIVRQPDRVLVVAKNSPELDNNPNTEQAKKAILDSVMQPLAQIITALGCQVEIFR